MFIDPFCYCSKVQCTNLVRTDLAVEYAGRQKAYPGVDQINVVVPAALEGTGTIDLTIVVGNSRSNSATVNIK